MYATDPREQLIRRRLAAPLGGKAGSEHPDPELVAAHAAGELSPEYGLAITRHLTVCDDGRCTAILRDAIAGAAVARDALYGRTAGAGLSEAPPADDVAADEVPADALPTNAPRAAPMPSDILTDETAGPMVEPEGVRARTFDCPDDLWAAFEALATDQEIPIDALVEEAMETFAKERRARAAEATPLPPQRLVMPRDVTVREAPHVPPRERNTPTLPRAYLPRAPASSRRSSPLPTPTADHLSVIFEGMRYEVTKERFVVGRGGLASDLAIDDPGVSRMHALVERAGGAYYLVDMGSTNGVEYQGERIARKEIAHGDRFRIGDHELEFLFT